RLQDLRCQITFEPLGLSQIEHQASPHHPVALKDLLDIGWNDLELELFTYLTHQIHKIRHIRCTQTDTSVTILIHALDEDHRQSAGISLLGFPKGLRVARITRNGFEIQ